MKVIGITGGVGCGKSAVLSLIKENFNAYVIEADKVGKDLMQQGEAAYVKIVDIFGEEILLEDGEIDRKKLADIVFHNKNKLMVLNSIVHPLVKKYITEEMGRQRCGEKYDYFVIEAALLLEDHYEVLCDEIWYIHASREIRISRLTESRGYSSEKIEDLFANQLSEEEFMAKCDRVIENSGDISETLIALQKIL